MTVECPSNTTNARGHHHNFLNSRDLAAPLRELGDAFILRAVTLALTDQQFMPRHLVEEWADMVADDRRDRLVVGLYYAGIIDHDTARRFVPMLDEERS